MRTTPGVTVVSRTISSYLRVFEVREVGLENLHSHGVILVIILVNERGVKGRLLLLWLAVRTTGPIRAVLPSLFLPNRLLHLGNYNRELICCQCRGDWCRCREALHRRVGVPNEEAKYYRGVTQRRGVVTGKSRKNLQGLESRMGPMRTTRRSKRTAPMWTPGCSLRASFLGDKLVNHISSRNVVGILFFLCGAKLGCHVRLGGAFGRNSEKRKECICAVHLKNFALVTHNFCIPTCEGPWSRPCGGEVQHLQKRKRRTCVAASGARP